MNIGKAMEKFQKKPVMCDRCGNIGATVKCIDCRKTYHGYHCSTLYMIFIDVRQYQCFECRNKENFRSLNKSNTIEKSEIHKMKKTAPKDHLLCDVSFHDRYIPQIDDEVYYFFQGHEQFVSLFNCFFYCGDEEELPFSYPWVSHQQLQLPTVCRILQIAHKFPSKNALALIKKFGDKGELHQNPQIVSRIKLEIVSGEQTFEVDYFPSSLPDFLVPRKVYEESLLQYNKLIQSGTFIGKVFKKRGREQIKCKILAVKNYEDSVNPDTNWETVVCQLEDQYRFRPNAGRRSNRRNGEALDQDSTELISFWRLELGNDSNQIDQPCLEDNIKQHALQIISEFIGKKSDICYPFMERVPLSVAPDYREVIASEMYLTLITQRLSNNYYRSLNQLNFDIDLIHQNSVRYNSEDHELTLAAKEICQSLKRALRKQLTSSVSHNSNDEHSHHKMISNNQTEPVKITIINPTSASSTRQNKGRSNNNFSSTPTPPLNGRSTAPVMQQHSSRPLICEQTANIETTFKKNIDDQQNRGDRRQYQEEEKLAIDHSALYNPMFDHQTGSKRSRRLTRQNVRNVSSDMMAEHGHMATSNNNSSSKITIMLTNNSKQKDEEPEVENLLGKATRSSRNRKCVRKNLKESSESEASQGEYEEEDPVNLGAKKRTRNT